MARAMEAHLTRLPPAHVPQRGKRRPGGTHPADHRPERRAPREPGSPAASA